MPIRSGGWRREALELFQYCPWFQLTLEEQDRSGEVRDIVRAGGHYHAFSLIANLGFVPPEDYTPSIVVIN